MAHLPQISIMVATTSAFESFPHLCSANTFLLSPPEAVSGTDCIAPIVFDCPGNILSASTYLQVDVRLTDFKQYSYGEIRKCRVHRARGLQDLYRHSCLPSGNIPSR
jgi:hypothetical protein